MIQDTESLPSHVDHEHRLLTAVGNQRKMEICHQVISECSGKAKPKTVKDSTTVTLL
jgi:hypothetical protein